MISCWLLLSVALATPAVDVEGATLELPSGAVVSADRATLGADGAVQMQGGYALHGDLTITAETTRWMLSDGRGLFEGNVRAAQGNLKFSSDKVEVELGADSTVQRVVATGQVQVEQEARRAEGGRAVFTNGRLVLSENPVVRHGGNEMRGAEIVFVVGQETIECKACTMTVRGEDRK